MRFNAVVPSDTTSPSISDVTAAVATVISRPATTFVWITLLLVAVSNATLLVALAYAYISQERNECQDWSFVYSLIELRDSDRTYELKGAHQAFADRWSLWIGIAYAALATPFIYCGTVLLVSSLWTRQLSFGRPTPHRGRSSCRDCGSLRRFGLDGANFDDYVFVLELLETVLQTIQASYLSELMGSRVAVVYTASVLCANCCSGIVVHAVITRWRLPQLSGRLLHLMVDQLLDLFWATVPQAYYLALFRRWFHTCSPHNIMSLDQWHTLQSVANQLVITSWDGYCLATFGLVSMALVQRHVHIFLRDLPQPKSARTLPRERTTSNSGLLVQRWLHLAFRWLRPLHGMAVLAIAVVAGTGPVYGVCNGQSYPWLTYKPSCLGVDINCLDPSTTTSADDFLAVLSHYSLSSIFELYIINCPSVEMPRLPTDQLGRFFLINSTIKRWDADAAIGVAALPLLQELWFQDVTFVTVPEALLAQAFPPSLQYVYMENVNADTFLHHVNTTWTSVLQLRCTNCRLDRPPDHLHALDQLQSLELPQNAIHALEASSFSAQSTLSYLSLSANLRLSALPDQVWKLVCEALSYLDLTFTNISTIPDDAKLCLQQYPTTILATGTPLCVNATADPIQPWLQC